MANNSSSSWAGNTIRIRRILRRAGIQSRADLMQRYDKGSDYQDIKGLGPVRGKQLRQMVREYGEIEWEASMPDVPWDNTPQEGE